MKLSWMTRAMVPALGLVCAFGMAPIAAAQTAATPTGTMAPAAVPAGVKPAHPRFPKADRFPTAAAAAAHCPGDTVVWASFAKGKKFHVAGSPWYGKTKRGAYVCEKEALTYGFHQGKK